MGLRERGQRGERQTLSSYAHAKITVMISFVCCLSSKLRETIGRCPSMTPFPQRRGTALSLPSPLLCAWGCFCVSPTTSAVEVPWNESDVMKTISSEWPDSKSGLPFSPPLGTGSLECEAKSSGIWMFNSDWCIKVLQENKRVFMIQLGRECVFEALAFIIP